MIVSRFVFAPLKVLIDLDSRTISTCESIATGRAVLGDDWDAPCVDLIAADEWLVGPAFITRETHPRKLGVAAVLNVGPRDLWAITSAIGEAYWLRGEPIPTFKTAMSFFYGNPDPALKAMVAAACGVCGIDPAVTAFAKRARAADPARWNGIRAAAARQLAAGALR